MKKPLLLILLAFIQLTVSAQTTRQVKGLVADSTGIKLNAVGIKLNSPTDTLTTITNSEGLFTFKNVKSSVFTISATSLGFQSSIKKYLFKDDNTPITLPLIILKYESQLLNEVTVSGTPSVTIKEDTVEYRASDYELRENALAEDLLKKLPGIEVDKDGNVKAQGKAITKVRVNGKDFFGGDVKTATQQLPADIIDKIQIIDDYGDQANLTGIKDGDPDKILNIQVRADKNNGYFARGTLGGGNKERYQASVTANTFKDTKQISVLANLNNTNASLFNFSGGGGGGNRMQFRGGGRSRQSGAQTGSDGITSVSSIGLNYRDEWSKKVSSYGSYSFSNRNNDVQSLQLQQNNFQSNTILNDQNSENQTLNNNHRFNWNLEYKIDSLNYLKFSPSFSYSNSQNDGLTNFIQSTKTVKTSDGITNTNTSSNSPNLGANLLLNHRFAKRGRNVSLNLSLNNSRNTSDEDEVNDYVNYDPNGNNEVYRRQQLDILNRNLSNGLTLTYNEPLSRTSNLELNYNYNYSKYDNERQTYQLDEQGISAFDPSLSTNYDYSFTTNRIGLNYRVNQKRYNYSVGGSIQPTVLEGSAVVSNVFRTYRNTGLNLIPVARFSYNFSKTRSFNVRYLGRSNEPSYTQLQPIADLSNPQFPVYGNPDLNAEFNHSLNIRYNNFDFASGNVLFTNLNATFTQNKIVTDIILSRDPNIGSIQETRYKNTDGYYTVNGFYNFSKPFQEKKYVISLNGSANFNNNVSFSNSQKNTGRNWILSQGLNVQLNPNKSIEINPGFNYSYNQNSNDIITNTNTKVSTYGFNFTSKTYFSKTWLLGVDMSKTLNSGYSSLLASDPFIINTYLEKQFFKDKTGTLRLQAYDLLNESTSVSRNVTASTITDSRSNRLSRYFMLSFTMRLQKFNGQQAQQIGTLGRFNHTERRDGEF